MRIGNKVKSVCLLVLITNIGVAQIRLPEIFASNMVLQRNTEVNFWGWAKPKEKVTIEVSWSEQQYFTEANNYGRWQLKVKTNDLRGEQKVTISSISGMNVLENVLLGEVWLCTGQSNMAMPLKGFPGQPVIGSLQAIANSKNKNLRLFKVKKTALKEPQDKIENYDPWQETTPESVANFSAVAYFFGKQLQEILDVPVGLISSNLGATSIQAWMSKESLEAFPNVDVSNLDLSGRPNKIPTVLHNAMINPIIPYTIQGTIWYQGEGNRMEPDNYKKLFPTMVEDWRNRWDQGDFPFYFAQIAPYKYSGNKFFDDYKNTAFQREAQLQCAELIPHSGIAITMDIGSEKFIHPPKKKEVADRLLYHALNKTYGIKTVDPESPTFKSMIKKDDHLILSFDHAENGLFSFGELTSFEIAGEDKVFYPATAEIIEREKVLVKSDKVKKPVAVRYGWNNWVSGTLYDAGLLPASSFRTDNWKRAKRASTN